VSGQVRPLVVQTIELPGACGLTLPGSALLLPSLRGGPR
jgi:hypothetical protein